MTKLSERATELFNPAAGDRLHIIRETDGVWSSYYIDAETLKDWITGNIYTLQNLNKTAEFTIDFAAGDLWESMLCTPDLGTYPVVKIGTTSGGTEIADSEVCNPSYLFVLNKYFETSTTVYVNVTTGRVDCFSRYIKNRNS